MNTDHLTRQLDIIPLDKLSMPVNIIGCGAIGSFVALELAKMGVTRLKVWDDDVVSVENLNNQFYRRVDIDKPKALALQALVFDFTGDMIQSNARLFTPEDAAGLQGIVVSAVDTMKARRMIFEAIKDEPNAVKMIIDPRMSAEFYQQYTIDMNAPHWYEKVLFADSEAVPTPCTAKSTIYTATLAAGMVVKTVKNILLKQDYPKNVQWNIAASANNPMISFAGSCEIHKQ